MKRVMRKISDCILIAVLCLTLFLTALTPIAFAVAGTTLADVCALVGSEADVQSDDFMNLINAYVDFYSDLGQGDFLGALVDGTVDIPLSWFSLTTAAFEDVASAFTIPKDTLIMHPAGYNDLLYFINEAGEFVLYDNRSGGGGRVRDVEETDDACIDGDTFAKLAQMYNDHYGPKTTKEYISWRTDARYAEVTDNKAAPRLSFFTEGYFCGETDWQEVYLVPWYTDGTTDYFSQYQFHFYYETTKDDSGVRTMTLYCDVWDMLNGGDVQTITISDQLMDIRFIDFVLATQESRLLFVPYSSYAQYIQKPYYSSWVYNHVTTSGVGKNIMYSSDLSMIVNIGTYLGCWQSAVSAHDEGTCEFGCGHDTGYYCSDKQIYMNFNFIDTTKLTEDDVITLSGDTFYDYAITNSTTGDSTTVYNYITNNYNYPVSEDSGSSGEEDSGSASGDVNVSGNIDVGGSVDVNVNVNNNGSADGGSMPVDVNLENYLEQTPEQAKPITDFFAIFFDFLPAELLGLICLGVVVAIILRVWGR